MKFLLAAINAKYIHSNPAVYSLRAYAGERLQPYIELEEYTINQPMQDILADIYLHKPDVIGFSCYIWNWELVQRLIQELPKLLPDTDLWLGGPEVTYGASKQLRRYPQLTGIMVGEGEETFRELLEWYVENREGRNAKPASEAVKETGETGRSSTGAERKECDRNQPAPPEEMCRAAAMRSLQQIRGLCLPDVCTPAREPVDMNRIPFLYHHLEPFANKIIYYESSRGCPYRCSYCLSSIEKSVRIRDISVVKKELQFFLDHQVKQVKFIDRTFNCNHEHALAVWQYIYEHDNGVTNFHFEISADILRPDEIALLRRFRPGLAQLEIGVQTTNPQTIQAIQRVMNVERLSRIVASIHQGRNIHLHLDLIAGLPYEDYDSFARSFNRVYAMQPEQLQLGFLKVLKGSEMHYRAEEFDIRYLDNPPYEVLSTGWLSYEDVIRLKGIEEMVELYYNSNQYTHTLEVLEQAFDSPFTLFEALADYYREKGYYINNPARSSRYQILLEFAEYYDAAYGEVYRELLTLDFYLREKAKSRPAFAIDIKEKYPLFSEACRAFYQEEEHKSRFLQAYRDYDWKQLSRMTHMEPFVYPVWDKEKLKRLREENREPGKTVSGQWNYKVLFRYLERDPLTCEAGISVMGR